MLKVKELTIEGRKSPIGLDSLCPAFSWKLESDISDNKQEDYQLVIKKGDQIIWDSGITKAEETLFIDYQGPELEAKSIYKVYLNVTDINGEQAEYESSFETGLLSPENFKAKWITHDFEDDEEAIIVYSKKFKANQGFNGRLYISALGIYDVKINGQKVGDAYFAPGWTTYSKRLQYQTYDISSYLQEENTIEIEVANGWYKGILGFSNEGNHFGNRTALLAQIELTNQSEDRLYHLTNEEWTCRRSQRRYAEIYHGETIDYSQDIEQEHPVHLYEFDNSVLVSQETEPVRIVEELAAKELLITPKGEVVLDFGQNLTGVVRASIKAKKGTEVILRHAEALDENGNLFTINLRTAKATDTFITSGNDDVFMPIFTFHGFRYVEVKGLGEDIRPKDFVACVMHTDFESTGKIETSDEKVNRLWENIDWTLRDNHLDLPTDCPQRDERLGYTGDAGIFINTAVFHKNVNLIYQKWLRDVAADSSRELGVPMASPNILGPGGGIAIWHDAAAIIPWALWQYYGDKRILEERYETIKDCVEYSRGLASENGLIYQGQQLGDWVALDAEKGPMRKPTEDLLNPTLLEKRGTTDRYFVTNVFYLNSTKILADTAKILGNESDYETYNRLYQTIKSAIQEEYITRTGRIVSETQAGFALALFFDLLEEKDQNRAIQGLLDNFNEHRQHLTTGFVGTRLLPLVLSETGNHDQAGALFLKEDCPSWLYSVNLGATTIWELWDGVNDDGSFNKYEMNSLNHYSFASIGEWMYKKLGGLEIIEPAYKKSLIKPQFIKGITEMKTSLETPYGLLSCHAKCENGQYSFDVVVPFNTTAVIELPEKESLEVGSGQYHFEYETDLSYEKEFYTMDSLFGQVLEHPVGIGILQQYAPELLENKLFLQFASQNSIQEVCNVLPNEAKGLITFALAEMNKAEKTVDR
ncbi:alpha-L-rhamnosidase [Streptococcus moroccensis]|uniref:alpha-L-rhamnosidase n=1 Tax=Streptococcus moroccensis TaxID=1451356 RepID=A0ABT9YQG9_9STRE|nr:alpha-L-rhamnosidase [Streptococcus moroccensis]MDQ0221841.1 alpha-L-rhamnosidase [Streptococcus moroccensis]